MRTIYLITSLLLSTILADETVFAIKEETDRFSYYVQDTDTPGVYYKSGVRTSRMALRPTPFVKIAFDTGTEPGGIVALYSLTPVRSYPGFTLYEAPSPGEAVDIASRIWEEPGVRSAVPVFGREKRLK